MILCQQLQIYCAKCIKHSNSYLLFWIFYLFQRCFHKFWCDDFIQKLILIIDEYQFSIRYTKVCSVAMQFSAEDSGYPYLNCLPQMLYQYTKLFHIRLNFVLTFLCSNLSEFRLNFQKIIGSLSNLNIIVNFCKFHVNFVNFVYFVYFFKYLNRLNYV